jgi:hypothetical protein
VAFTIFIALTLAVTASPVRADDPSPKTISQQFALCETDAIKTTGWKEGDFYTQAAGICTPACAPPDMT